MTTVRLIAPSGYPNDSAIAERGVAFLQGQGCAVVNQACLARQHQRFAGGELARLADLHQIGTGGGQEIAMAIRGGYGLTRLLDTSTSSASAGARRRPTPSSSATATSPRSRWPTWPRPAA